MSAYGTRVAIGSSYNDHSGHVRVYELKESGWKQMGQDIDGEEALDYSGGSVSLNADGTIVAIGADGNDGNGDENGHVRVYKFKTWDNFEQVGDVWEQLGQDIDGEAAWDYSGVSVSLSADGLRLAIGAYGNDGNGSDSGHVRVYELKESGKWEQLGQDIDGEAEDDYSGTSVSLSADGLTVATGATRNGGNGP